MAKARKGCEKREFIRLDYVKPLSCKVCKKTTVSQLLQGFTSNISQTGLLCNVQSKVKKNDLVWLCFDRATLIICEQIEKNSLIYQSGVIGKVVRVEQKANSSFEVGVKFLTREEKNLTNIFPKSYFIKRQNKRWKSLK